MKARMLIIWLALPALTAATARGGESPEQLASAAETAEAQALPPISGQLPAEAKAPAEAASSPENARTKISTVVVAMEAKKGTSVHVGELVTAGAEPATFITRRNQRVELSPRSVAEFDESGSARLLRGSAYVESTDEATVRTAGARVVYLGKLLVSYDHAERSTSAFVLEGEARLENPHRDDSTIRLQRYRGATLVVGDVLPHLVRQLDVGAVRSWLKGYDWPEARRQALLKNMPGDMQVARQETPKHLEETKIEDYFSSIDTADEFHQPDYYDKKFDDPDKVVAEQNSKQQGAGKTLSPEEAALISLPKTQIDLGFELGPEVLSEDQKAKEVRKVEPPTLGLRRSPASAPNSPKLAKRAQPGSRSLGDPDVNSVLERLRRVKHGGEAAEAPEDSRSPSSVAEPVVPDPVYDYSQNF